MSPQMKKYLLSVVLLIAAIGLKATHITHGNLYCTFEKIDGDGNYSYILSLELYRDCNASTVQFDPNIEIGIYLSKSLKAAVQMTMVTEEDALIQSTAATTGQSYCYKKGMYEGRVTIPAPPVLDNNYMALFQRCCRPTLTNINSLDIGSSFYVNFSSENKNSSPKNYSSGLFVINAGQQATLSLGNTDADGDVLTYKLTNAWQGASNQNPSPSPVFQIDNTTFLPVPHNNNYSGTKPFGGALAYANLDTITGQLEVFTNTQGLYLVAYEVAEWRGNKKINSYYRETYIVVGKPTQNKNNILLQAKGIGNAKAEIVSFWNHTIATTIDSFVVERSTDSVNWTKVGSTSASLLNFKDASVTANQEYWYRVYASTGGNKVYSNVVKTGVANNGTTLKNTEADKINIKTYPNPASSELFITGASQNSNVLIYNTLGEMVKTTPLPANNKIDIATLPTGIYYLQILQGETQQTIKFVKN
jgi:hypothetical protein